jgi:hypothetical protein
MMSATNAVSARTKELRYQAREEAVAMTRRMAVLRLTVGAVFLGSLLAFHLPFREYPAIEYNDFPHHLGLSGEDGVGIRAIDVSSPSRRLLRAEIHGRIPSSCTSLSGERCSPSRIVPIRQRVPHNATEVFRQNISLFNQL